MLYDSRDVEGDFSVKLKNGKSLKIHSLILQHHSEVLAKMMFADFKEKKEKTIQFRKYNDEAVLAFIKFLYGYELNHENDVTYEAAMELIEMGGVYDIREVQNAAAAYVIEKYLKVENVFDVMQVCKENNAEEAVDLCAKFAATNFGKKELVESGRIKKFPEIAVKFLENDVTSGEASNKLSIISFPEFEQQFHFSEEKTTRGSIDFNVSTNIQITGIGLMLCSHNANVVVNVNFLKSDDKRNGYSLYYCSGYFGNQKVNTAKESYQRIMFDNPQPVSAFKDMRMSLDFTGSLAVSRINNLKNKGLKRSEVKGRDFHVSFGENSLKGILTDIFFYVEP